MRPVDQTRFGRPEGNCLMACLASILEVPLDQLPDLHEQECAGDSRHWFERADAAVREHGHVLAYVGADIMPPPGFHVASGLSPRGLSHATVWQGRTLVHDPHPSRDGIGPITDWILVFPSTPGDANGHA